MPFRSMKSAKCLAFLCLAVSPPYLPEEEVKSSSLLSPWQPLGNGKLPTGCLHRICHCRKGSVFIDCDHFSGKNFFKKRE